MTITPGRIIGQAGISADGNSWANVPYHVLERASNAEKKTAQELNKLAAKMGGPTVLHDVKVPIQGRGGYALDDGNGPNIDHIIVSGNEVILIDTKWWAPGLYWPLGNQTMRGLQRHKAADRRGVIAAHSAFVSKLASTPAKVSAPLVLVWPSSDNARLVLLPGVGNKGARYLAATHGIAWLGLRRLKPANAAIVAELIKLVNNK